MGSHVEHDGAGKGVEMTSWFFDDGKGDNIVGLVGQAEMGAETPLRHVVGKAWRILEEGFAQGIVADPQGMQRGRHGDAGTERLAEGLLGGKALGQEAGRRGAAWKAARSDASRMRSAKRRPWRVSASSMRATRTMSVPTPWITPARRARQLPA
jgi:hypothetical protein